MRVYGIIVCIILLAMLIGCNGSQSGTDRGITVEISDSRGFGSFNEDPFVTYEGGHPGTTAGRIERAVHEAEKQPGIVDIAEPKYDIRFTYTDGSTETYHLWLDEWSEYATVMRSEDTHFIYRVSKTSTVDLKEIIGN
ncbi:hypothetical protein [Paenibacillus thermotolerans]|uniref:hypothetical protein n=1 Tax=Paenibacillus thermotolerans TaxID=3027807 RepID=UPI00236864CD|nr:MULTISPECIES: hypothetical protein [unclassified Paenibacillus]